MSIDAVMSRINEIQGQIDTISGATGSSGDRLLGAVGTGTSKPSTSTAATSKAFTEALDRARTTATTPAATTTSAAAATPTAPVVPAVATAPAPSSTPTTAPVTVRTAPVTASRPAPASTTPTQGGDLGAKAVDLARQYMGIPYRWGGTDPRTGLDCSGLVQLVYSRLGVQLPRVAIDQARAGTAVPSLAQAVPGDLIAFNGGDHIGIYIGNGKMIDAPHTGARVRVDDVAGFGSIYAIRHLGGSTSATAATPTAATGGLSAYQGLFTAAEQRYHLPTGLLRAIAQVESGGNAAAVSRAGAQGLMQLMPGTARGLGVDPFSPAQAIDGAARLMASNLNTFGNTDLAVAAYNAGAGAVRRYNGVPPYPETQAYVLKVRAAMTGGAA